MASFVTYVLASFAFPSLGVVWLALPLFSAFCPPSYKFTIIINFGDYVDFFHPNNYNKYNKKPRKIQE